MDKLQKISKRGYYILDDINEFIPLLSMMKKCPYFIRLSNKFNISIEELEKIVVELNIPHKNMFTFVKRTHGYKNDFSVLVEEKTDKEVVTRKGITHTYYYDTFVTEYTYITLCNQEIVECILDKKYHNLFEHSIFFKEVARFNESVNINPKSRITDLPLDVKMNLTCQDLVDIINGSVDFANDKIKKSKVKHYADSECFYVELEPRTICGFKCDNSLAIPYDVLTSKDWKLVEDKFVHSIIKNNAKLVNGKINGGDNFFSGSQSHAPYYSTDEVKQIKEIFLKYL
jgi:hypothetical protein